MVERIGGWNMRFSQRLQVGLIAGLFLAVLGAEVQCPGSAGAQRGPLAALQAQVDSLQDELNSVPIVVDGDGQVVGHVVGVIG